MNLDVFARIIGSIICGVGVLFLAFGVIEMIKISSATKVVGNVIDFVQEYTSRGFLWKAKVEFEHDGIQRTHITRARTMRRGSGPINLYVSKNGQVMEKLHAIENIIFGTLALLISFIIIFIL
jgi:hypothetical protein